MDNKYEKPVFKNIEFVIVDGIKRVKNKKTGEIVKHSLYDDNRRNHGRKGHIRLGNY